MVEVLNHLGHSVSYTSVCATETAQAQKPQMLANQNQSLPLKPATPTDIILTYFWADKFDMNTETVGGSGAINTTHLVAFQETSENSIVSKTNVNVTRLKRRSVQPVVQEQPPAVVIPKKDPSQIRPTHDSPTFDDTCYD